MHFVANQTCAISLSLSLSLSLFPLQWRSLSGRNWNISFAWWMNNWVSLLSDNNLWVCHIPIEASGQIPLQIYLWVRKLCRPHSIHPNSIVKELRESERDRSERQLVFLSSIPSLMSEREIRLPLFFSLTGITSAAGRGSSLVQN